MSRSQILKSALYPLFGLLITLASGFALIDQFHETPDVDVVPDLFIGLDCDKRLWVSISPEVAPARSRMKRGEGKRDSIDIDYVPEEKEKLAADRHQALDNGCTQLVLFSYEELRDLGSSAIEIRTIKLKDEKTQVYVARVDLQELARRHSLAYLASVTLPSHWPKSTRGTKVFRLYLHSRNLPAGAEVAAAFNDPVMERVTRAAFDLAYPADKNTELISSIPAVNQASTVMHTGPYMSPPTRYESVIPVEPSVESLVLAVRDNRVKEHRDVVLALISALFGIGLTITVDAIGKRLEAIS